MKKNEVYVVTTGEYSDYHIVGCFDNKKQAETCARLSVGEVETYYINDIEYKDNRNAYIVYYYIFTGKVECRQYELEREDENFELAPVGYSIIPNKYITARVRANSEEEAIKIGLDKIAKFRANEEGI